MESWKVAGKWEMKILGCKMENACFLHCKMEWIPPIVLPLKLIYISLCASIVFILVQSLINLRLPPENLQTPKFNDLYAIYFLCIKWQCHGLFPHSLFISGFKPLKFNLKRFKQVWDM